MGASGIDDERVLPEDIADGFLLGVIHQASYYNLGDRRTSNRGHVRPKTAEQESYPDSHDIGGSGRCWKSIFCDEVLR